jgi:hypothetical protein
MNGARAEDGSLPKAEPQTTFEELTTEQQIEALAIQVDWLTRAVIDGLNTLADIVQTIADNAEQPHTLAEKLRAMLDVEA